MIVESFHPGEKVTIGDDQKVWTFLYSHSAITGVVWGGGIPKRVPISLLHRVG
jgi:hypothetical protein